MNLHGIGTDLVDHTRFAQAMAQLGEAFLNRIFTAAEQEYCQSHANPLPHFAARFAAKEAVAKAFGTGIGKHAAFKEIEVVRLPTGAPAIRLHGNAAAFAASRQISDCRVSLSHTDSHALAYAMVLSCACTSQTTPSGVSPV